MSQNIEVEKAKKVTISDSIITHEISILEEEKNSFQDLNKRFENYIDHIRNINSNSLNSSILEDFDIKSLDNYIQAIKSKYEELLEKKLKELETFILQNTALRKRENELEDELERVIDKREKEQIEKRMLDDRMKKCEQELIEKDEIINQMKDKIENMQNTYDGLKKEYTFVYKENFDNKQLLNESTENIIKLNLAIDSLNEKINLNDQTYKEQLELANKSFQELKEHSICCNNKSITESLLDVKNELFEELENAKSNVVSHYRSNLLIAQTEIEHLKKELDEIKIIKQHSESEARNYKDLYKAEKTKNSDLKFKIQNIETEYQTQIEILKKKLEDSEDKQKEVKEKLNETMGDYDVVISKHLNLNTELEIYKKLLEGEEDRLGISTPTQEFSQKIRFSYKQLYAENLHVSAIDEINVEYIKLFNITEKSILLSGCKIKVTDGSNAIIYKIPRITIRPKRFLILGKPTTDDVNEKNIKIRDMKTFTPVDNFNTICIINSKDKVILEMQIIKSIPITKKDSKHLVSRKRTFSKLINLNHISPINKRANKCNNNQSNIEKSQHSENDNNRDCRIL